MDVLLDRGGRNSFVVAREYRLHDGDIRVGRDVTALSFSGDGGELIACGLSGKVVAFLPKTGGRVRISKIKILSQHFCLDPDMVFIPRAPMSDNHIQTIRSNQIEGPLATATPESYYVLLCLTRWLPPSYWMRRWDPACLRC